MTEALAFAWATILLQTIENLFERKRSHSSLEESTIKHAWSEVAFTFLVCSRQTIFLKTLYLEGKLSASQVIT